MRQNVCTTYLIFFLSAGIILIALGGFIAVFWNIIFKSLLANKLELSPYSRSFSEWKSPSVELYFDVYLFNWTNADSFVYPNFEKPIFEELGPYRFREVRDKIDINFYNNNSTVSYKTINYYTFDEDASNGTLDDVVTNLNMVAIGAASFTGRMDYHMRKSMSQILHGYYDDIFVTKTARELLFEGYEDYMIMARNTIKIPNFDMNQLPNYDRAGWFYLKNATDKLSGVYNVNTGQSDISKLGTIQQFNGNDHHAVYKGKCSKLDGSTGELYPPDQTRESINLFIADMCRSIPFDYEKDVQVNDVVGYRFTAGTRAIDNGTQYSDNLCYSDGNTDKFPSGVMNISACQYSVPLFMSYPHFFEADSFYLNGIDGLKSDRELHQSYITLEPTTGAPLEVVIRFQTNFLLREIENIALYQGIQPIFIPAMWCEQKFQMNALLAEQLKHVPKITLIGQIIGIGIFSVGIVLLIISGIIKCITKESTNDADINMFDVNAQNRRQNEKNSPLLNANGRSKVVIKKAENSVE